MNLDRIVQNPKVMNGQPCIKGTRLTVRRVLSAVATYPDRSELFQNYPELNEEAVKQALEYAAASVEDRAIDLVESP